MLDAANEYCSMWYNKMMYAIADGCSTPEALMVLLNDCPIESLKIHHIDNKYLLFFACQHIGYEHFALQLWKLYPEAAVYQDGWENHRNPLQIACIKGCIDTLDYAIKFQEIDAFMSDDYDEEFWSIVTIIFYEYMHKARIYVYKYLMNDTSEVGLEIDSLDVSPYILFVKEF